LRSVLQQVAMQGEREGRYQENRTLGRIKRQESRIKKENRERRMAGIKIPEREVVMVLGVQ
jgi:hypothetical protein